MPLIVLGGIYSVVFTPTEAAAVAVVYSAVVGSFVYKDIKHLHIATQFTSGKEAHSSAKDAIAEAKTHAALRDLDIKGLEVAVSNDAEHCHRPHRIDPETKTFVPLLVDKAGEQGAY